MVPGLMRPTSRAVLRNAKPTTRLWQPTKTRFVSTQPPHLRSRTWKSSALRWGIAVAGIYYYNTSPVFAEQPHHNLLNPNVEAIDEANEPSALDELVSRRSREAQKNHEALAAEASVDPSQDAPEADVQGAAELEAEAQGEGAFNPETGEINWDCPCLGGMAHGPCGPEFREAFSCFIYSQEEPKGMECIEKFQGMRDCFQQHPEVYADELMEDEELDAELEAEKQELVNQIAERRKADDAAASSAPRLLEEPAPPAKASTTAPNRKSTSSAQPQSETRSTTDADGQSEPTRENVVAGRDSTAAKSTVAPPVTQDGPKDEGDELVPKAAHDARDAGPSSKKE